MNKINKVFTVMFATILIFGCSTTLFAKDGDTAKGKSDLVSKEKGTTGTREEKDAKTLAKEVTGEVSGISNNFIAVVYSRDEAKHSEKEIPLTIEGAPRLEHIGNLSQIKLGDTVTVQYDELIGVREDGKEIVTGRRAKVIKFIRPAPKEPPAVEEPEEMTEEQ